jgi:putative aminopeptidase FrvX
MDKKYIDFAVDQAVKLLAIDSPTGYTHHAGHFVLEAFKSLGYAAHLTKKGGVFVNLDGEDEEDGLLLEAHMDTLGGMVAEIKANGRLRIVNVGGLNANNVETENCVVVTKNEERYEGTLHLINASLHVNEEYNAISRQFDKMEVVLDEKVSSAEEVKALGIHVGDFVCFEPRTRVTTKGYIKSRFLDDKLSVGILLGLAYYLKEEKIVLPRTTYIHITVYEEVGHGGAASVPKGITEAIAVDMGCVGEGLECTEHQVSICAKDSTGPFAYEVVKKLMAAAEAEKADYAVDIYPFYGSDVKTTLAAGHDIRHGLIGPGVYASHGYERSHRDGVENTLKVLKGYLKI